MYKYIYKFCIDFNRIFSKIVKYFEIVKYLEIVKYFDIQKGVVKNFEHSNKCCKIFRSIQINGVKNFEHWIFQYEIISEISKINGFMVTLIWPFGLKIDHTKID